MGLPPVRTWWTWLGQPYQEARAGGTSTDQVAACGSSPRTRDTSGSSSTTEVHTARTHREATFVTATMLDAGVDLREVQMSARHADRARKTVHGHSRCILATSIAPGT